MEVQPNIENKTEEQQKGEGDILLRDQPSYKQKEYWNERYKVKETFYDWYCGYPELKPVFDKCYNLKKDSKILMVGCGNSKLSEDMFDDGYTNIISTDISDVVIEQLMKDAKQKNKNMIFEVQDCTKLSYEDQTFDFVFDKGTLDAISCDLEAESVSKMVNEMMRVCKQSGQVVIVSFGQLHERRQTFQKSLGLENYSYQLCKKYLSIDSQLTNIMRHISNGLPMNLVLKDKTLLFQTLVELRKIKSALNNEVIKSVEIDWDNLRTVDEKEEEEQEDHKVVEKLDEYKVIEQPEIKDQEQNDNNKGNNENQQQCDKQQLSSFPKNVEAQIEQNSNVSTINKEQNEEQAKQEEEESSDECEEEEGEQEEKKPKFRRQTQCFIYRIQNKN